MSLIASFVFKELTHLLNTSVQVTRVWMALQNLNTDKHFKSHLYIILNPFTVAWNRLVSLYVFMYNDSCSKRWITTKKQRHCLLHFESYKNAKHLWIQIVGHSVNLIHWLNFLIFFEKLKLALPNCLAYFDHIAVFNQIREKCFLQNWW